MDGDAGMLQTFSGISALGASLLVPPGVLICLIMSQLTWTGAEDRQISDPSGLWSIAMVAFLAMGFLLAWRADQVRERPSRPWRFLPGLDEGYIRHYCNEGGMRPRPWVIAGRLLWIGWICTLGLYIAGDELGLWPYAH